MTIRKHVAVLRFRHKGEFVADIDLVDDPCLEACREDALIRAIERASKLQCDQISDGELVVVLDTDVVWSSRGEVQS